MAIRTVKPYEAMTWADQDDHLLNAHKFDEEAVWDADRDSGKQSHAQAHKAGPLIWEPHTHADAWTDDGPYPELG